ncbi:MAG: hypothetical protein FJ011_25035 [Chloroflexi bacterium]|nr:hypothetical protein [Chloroflexota bacterium]
MKQTAYAIAILCLAGVLAGCLAAPAPVTAPPKSEVPVKSEQAQVRVLARGAPIHGANGIGFDAQNRLYIASINGGEIVVMDPETGKIIERIGAERGVDTPDDLAFGPDGSLYWTSLYGGQIGRLSPDGKMSTAAQLPPGANPITFSDDGRLFVALDFLGDALYEVDPAGKKEPRLIAKDLGFLNGMDWGQDGRLYGPIWTKGQVVKVNVDTGEIKVVAEGLVVPSAVKFDAQGRLHVLDFATGKVARINLQTGGREELAQLAPSLDNLAFDAKGRLFISNAEQGSVIELLSDGKSRPVSPAGMIAPGGVAVVKDAGGQESVFVVDSMTLCQFDAQAGASPQPGKTIARFMPPNFTVAPFGDKLVMSSYMGNLVQIVDPATGKIVHTDPSFKTPLNAIQFGGDLVVAELGTNRIVRQTSAGPVSLAEGIAVPTGLAASGRNLWAADWASGAVFQIVKDDVALKPAVQVATGLKNPEGLAVAADGGLLVVEAGAGRLSHIDLTTGKVKTVADGLEIGLPLPHMPPTAFFNGVAVGASGDIYVTGDKGSVLYHIKP